MPLTEASIPPDILASPHYDELGVEAGLEEGVNDSGPWARKPYRVAWADRGRFVQALLGANTTVTGPSGPWIRPTRFRYPDTSFADNIFVKGVSIKGDGDHANVGSSPKAYTDAIVTVDFGILDFLGDDPGYLNSISDDPDENEALQYATQELDFTAEYVNVPSKAVGFTDGTKYDIPMHIRVGVVKMNITWHKLPYIPVVKVKDYIDSVNQATFMGGARGTVFFDGAKTIRELDSKGQITQKVMMSFKWRKQDWNKFLRPDTGDWDTIIFNGNSLNTTFPYKDFRQLIPSNV